MNIREISKPVTAKSLNESLAKKFGAKVNVEAFTIEQLEDARNKIRTKLFQVETNESFDTVVKDEGYQKSKLFLDVLNAEISERTNVAEGELPAALKAYQDKKNKGKKPAKKSKSGKMPMDDNGTPDDKSDDKPAFLKKESIVREEEASPEERLKALSDLYKVVMDNIKRTEEIMYMTPPGMNRDQYEQEIAQMQKRAEGIKKDAQALKAGMQGADDIRAKATSTESIVREGAEDQAELVMAAKDMVDRLTGWMEDTAEMQTESMLELADAIRDEMGSEQSEAFVNAVKPALEAMYGVMETTRAALTSGVGQLTGEAQPEAMGAEEEMPAEEPAMEPTVDAEVDAELPADDGMDAAAAAAGGEEEAGRAKRESIERSRKLGTILSKKK